MEVALKHSVLNDIYKSFNMHPSINKEYANNLLEPVLILHYGLPDLDYLNKYYIRIRSR